MKAADSLAGVGQLFLYAADAFLTNDAGLKRVTEIKSILVDDLEP